MVEGTSAEPTTLAYEWYLSGDQGSLHGFEKYADSDAMISHVNGFLEKWAARFTGCLVIDSLVVYGDPSPAAREILDGWHAAYMEPWKGFSRFAPKARPDYGEPDRLRASDDGARERSRAGLNTYAFRAPIPTQYRTMTMPARPTSIARAAPLSRALRGRTRHPRRRRSTR